MPHLYANACRGCQISRYGFRGSTRKTFLEQLHHIKVLIMHVFKEKEKKVEKKQHRSDEIFSYDIINKRISHKNVKLLAELNPIK